jgi:hypothetical protein
MISHVKVQHRYQSSTQFVAGVNYTGAVVHLELRILRAFSKKIRKGPNDILRGLGKIIHEIKLKFKILWHCPFSSR